MLEWRCSQLAALSKRNNLPPSSFDTLVDKEGNC